PAVVVRRRVGEAQQRARADGGTRAARAVLGDDRATVKRGVVDVEEPVPRVTGVEREPEQPLLTLREHEPPDVEEGRPVPPGDPDDPPTLLDDEDRARLRGGGSDVERRGE